MNRAEEYYVGATRAKNQVYFLAINDTPQIMTHFKKDSYSVKVDEYNTKAIKTFLYFCQSAIAQFQRVDNEELFSSFVKMLLEKKVEYGFLQDVLLKNFYEQIINIDAKDVHPRITEILSSMSHKKPLCILEPSTVFKENSPYSQKLNSLVNPTFDEIKSIAYKYIQSIGDKQELYDRLIRGEAIIDDEVLLYKYLASFGGKHKAKLYSAYDAIIDKLRHEKFNIVDWACGQGMATIVLLNYARERNIELNIENITLIEPSSLALSRALLHVDVLKQKEYNICAINSDFDCLDAETLECSNGLKTLHLFSNILDVENFSLDTNFFKKVSQSSDTASIFVCVGPNRNDKLNNRLDLFFNYFDENFDTELIASRDTDINGTTRYEKIFEVKKISEEVVQKKRDEIQIVQKSYQLDILDALNNYSNYVVPILNMKILEDSINSDPEYAIFKIRKVAEVITSKIYSQYEENERTVSFNDKIRYLAYEKKVFDKTITNYVQTIRTIGNRGVHEEDRDVSKQKLDAHLMVIALVSFLNELTDKKLLK